MSRFDYDLITIGGGSGGVRASRLAGARGVRVALIEEKQLGGTCVNAGCIPKKLFSYAAHYSADFTDAAGFGWTLGERAFDWRTLIENKDREIARLNGVYAQLLAKAGVDVISGRGRVVDGHTVEAAGRRFTAEHILIATGGRPSVPDVPGADLAITSDQAFHLARMPQRVVIVGAGYIAVEFASIFNGLGAKVTLVHRRPQILRGFDDELGAVLAEEMAAHGVTLRLEARVARIESSGGALAVHIDNGDVLGADAVMYATGRVPNTRDLGLEAAGVELAENGAIKVDELFCTSVPSIHAVGDAIDRMLLTPVALAEGTLLVEGLFMGSARHMDYSFVPTAVFSHPNVGTVGLTEAEARNRHGEITVFKTRFRPLKATLGGGAGRMFMKLVVDAASDRVLGAHMVGEGAGEIIQGIAIALKCGATKAQFDATLGIHPTSAEEFVTMREPAAQA